ncbi:DUF3833 family protein [Rhizobium sp. Root1220]|uniref:DUF3833 family protein n=1 Tax=Rhizobium sp. Root1220 TaxID=1736432 RepID=UPI0006FCD681|nr:DUF3833 family protein [Rhizobium sp. Root1220]KQV82775.1 hypothetical protein ASC90_23290 [Rhizobium sp. Root1220]
MRHRLLFVSVLATALVSALPTAARELRLEEFFSGHSNAVGRFQAINGVDRSFKVGLTGRWDGMMLTLREDFHYADGERDRKTWRFTKIAPDRYIGIREDVVGQAMVKIDGDVARYSYLVDLAPGPKRNIVRFHDTLRLQPDGTLLNTAWVTKFAFPVARVRVSFTRQ